MSTREKQIYDLISLNPLISQEEIAEKLNITRSSVSVYITNMMKKGVIKGRGYIIEQDSEASPVCIGTLAADFFGRVDDSSGDNTLFDNGDLSMSYGGCGKNVAESLSLLGYKPSIIAAVGNDVLGKEILNECTKLGIDVSSCLSVSGHNTASYLDIRKPDGSLFMGLSNWKINYELKPDIFSARSRILSKADWIIIDDSIPVESIRYLSNTYGRRKLVLQSTARLPLVREALGLIGLVITDISYLSQLFDLDLGEIPRDRQLAGLIARNLIAEGVSQCLFTFDENRLCYLYDGKLYYSNASFNDALEEKPLNQRYSASRSALAAVALYSIDRNWAVESLLRHVAAARHHIAVYGRRSSYLLTGDALVKHLEALEDNLQIFPLNV
ncbi:MAG: winged helix-turn-helix transcriptional regulator [Erysipelotrichaceae bacterium]|nr:winged helix-turn-helix transcriptional regulator [Erysipelotrichaceae bacterium]